jgi:hypothetical protein
MLKGMELIIRIILAIFEQLDFLYQLHVDLLDRFHE